MSQELATPADFEASRQARKTALKGLASFIENLSALKDSMEPKPGTMYYDRATKTMHYVPKPRPVQVRGRRRSLFGQSRPNSLRSFLRLVRSLFLQLLRG